MAKCLKYYVTRNAGYVDRVSDEKAAWEVASGKAVYCPKNWWKRDRENRTS